MARGTLITAQFSMQVKHSDDDDDDDDGELWSTPNIHGKITLMMHLGAVELPVMTHTYTEIQKIKMNPTGVSYLPVSPTFLYIPAPQRASSKITAPLDHLLAQLKSTVHLSLHSPPHNFLHEEVGCLHSPATCTHLECASAACDHAPVS